MSWMAKQQSLFGSGGLDRPAGGGTRDQRQGRTATGCPQSSHPCAHRRGRVPARDPGRGPPAARPKDATTRSASRREGHPGGRTPKHPQAESSVLQRRSTSPTATPAPTRAMTLPTQLTKFRNAPSGCAPVCPWTATLVCGRRPDPEREPRTGRPKGRLPAPWPLYVRASFACRPPSGFHPGCSRPF